MLGPRGWGGGGKYHNKGNAPGFARSGGGNVDCPYQLGLSTLENMERALIRIRRGIIYGLIWKCLCFQVLCGRRTTMGVCYPGAVEGK